MISIFEPHPEIPDHYSVKDGYVLVTSDIDKPYFRWSRLIRNNYEPVNGFLSHSGMDRIALRIYEHDGEDDYTPLDHLIIAEQLKGMIPEGKEAILHYKEHGIVMTVVTGIATDMYSQLKEEYKAHYYENH